MAFIAWRIKEWKLEPVSILLLVQKVSQRHVKCHRWIALVIAAGMSA